MFIIQSKKVVLLFVLAGIVIAALSLNSILDRFDPGRELYEELRVNAHWGNGRCGRADEILRELETKHPNSRYVSRAKDEVAQCYYYNAMDTWRKEGNSSMAIEELEMLMDSYPETDYASRAKDRVLDIFSNLSDELMGKGLYDEAIETLEKALEKYPDSEERERIEDKISAYMDEHAARLMDDGRYGESLGVLRRILDDYPDTIGAGDAEKKMVEGLYDWGIVLQEGNEFEKALERFNSIINEHPDLLISRDDGYHQTHDLAMEALSPCRYDWARWLRERGDYEEALEKYRDLLNDEKYGEDVEKDIPATCFEWATSLEENGRFEEALEKYNLVIDNYSSYPYHDDYESKAEDSKPGCYYEWVESLIAENRYGEAFEKYSLLLDEYPDSEYASEEASNILSDVPPDVLFTTATSYRDTGHYDPAIRLYKAITKFSPESDIASNAETAAIETEIEKIYREKHGELPPPIKEAEKELGGNCELVVINDTPYELTILVKGPETRSIIIEASPNSTIRVIPPMAFQRPPAEAERTIIRLTPGNYQVAAKVSDPDVNPFYGEWDLDKDAEYSRWMYIIRTF